LRVNEEFWDSRELVDEMLHMRPSN
jgi:hypothetical protein